MSPKRRPPAVYTRPAPGTDPARGSFSPKPKRGKGKRKGPRR